MIGYLIVSIVSIILTAFICLTFFINKKDNEKIKQVKEENKILAKQNTAIKQDIKEIDKTIKEVIDEKTSTNIDDLLSKLNSVKSGL